MHAPPGRGQRHTFAIRLTNQSPHPAGGVVDMFTAGRPLRIVSAHAALARCTTRLPVRCQLGTLTVDARVTLRIVAVSQVAGVLSTTAAGHQRQSGPNPANSIATARTLIAPAPTSRPKPRPPPPRVAG